VNGETKKLNLVRSPTQGGDMADYIFLMHDDAAMEAAQSWEDYIRKLMDGGWFEGGSVIGNGVCMRKNGAAPPVTAHVVGYIRVNARDIAHAQSLLSGNPHFEAGGTVEIRELPRTG
jgi:hypothetical protein